MSILPQGFRLLFYYFSSPVFCNGQILDLVGMSDIFDDVKDFVDRPLLEPPDEVVQKLLNAYSEGGITGLERTVLNLTSLPGLDLLEWEPPDWTPRYKE